MDVSAVAWLTRAVRMTGGAAWGAGLVGSAVLPIWFCLDRAGWPTSNAGFHAGFERGAWWSLALVSAYCGLSCWAVLDWARYNAELKAKAWAKGKIAKVKKKRIDTPLANARAAGHDEMFVECSSKIAAENIGHRIVRNGTTGVSVSVEPAP